MKKIDQRLALQTATVIDFIYKRSTKLFFLKKQFPLNFVDSSRIILEFYIIILITFIISSNFEVHNKITKFRI